MRSLRSEHLYRFSLFLFCSFPALILLGLKGLVAMLFVIIQVYLIFSTKAWRRAKGYWYPVLQMTPFLFYFISLTYSDNLFYGSKYLERSTLLFLLPWVFFFNKGSMDPKRLKSVLNYFGLMAAAWVIYTLLRMWLQGTFLAAAGSNQAYVLIRTSLESISGMHPTYFSIVVAIAFFVFQSGLKKKALTRGFRVIAVVASLVLASGLIIASSKMILSATFIGSLIIWSENLRTRAVLIRSGIALAMLAMVVLAVEPLQVRLKEMTVSLTQDQPSEQYPDSMRKIIYSCALEVISQNPWLGTGIGDQQDMLNAKYKENGYELAFSREFNTHNQYLQLWLSSGILPLVIFLILSFAQLLVAVLNRNYLFLSVMVLMLMGFLTENLLARQDGVFIYGFFSSFLAYASWKNRGFQVAINGRFKSQSQTGVQRFAKEISNKLLEKNNVYKLITIQREKVEGHSIRSLPLFSGQLWEQFSLPLYLRLLGYPLLLNLGNSAPCCYKNQMVTIHDMAFSYQPKWFSKNFARWYGVLMKRVAKSAWEIFTVSKFSKSEIIREFGVPASKISVIYNGIPGFVKKQETASPPVQENYALTVGSLSGRKNQENIIKAFIELHELPLKLVIAGSINHKVLGNQSPLRKLINEANNVEFIENPTDQDLIRLYSHADFSIYLPFYEGFGLPVLESLACQKPVVLSDIPVFRELFEGCGLFTDPGDVEQVKAHITEMYKNQTYWVERINENKSQWQKYSYQNSADKIHQTLKSCLKSNAA